MKNGASTNLEAIIALAIGGLGTPMSAPCRRAAPGIRSVGNPMTMKGVKHALRLLAVNAFILVVGVTAIELVFGGWLGRGRLDRLNLLRDCKLEIDVSGLYEDPNPVITYTRDRYGLRGSHSSPGEIDILTVGGSTTDQRYVRDGETWQDVLQRRFESTGRRVVVGNAGVDGQSTFGHIKSFEWWFPHIPGLAPEVVLLYVGLNDFYKDAGDHNDRLLEGDQGFGLRRSLSENSALWSLARTVRGAWEAMVVERIGHRSIAFEQLRWTRESLQESYGFMRRRLTSYGDRLRILARLSRDLGAEPIFVSQPSRRYRVLPHGVEGHAQVRSYEGREFNGVDYFHMTRRLDGVTQAVATEMGSVYVDLAGRGVWEDADFYDFEHMTPRGAEKVGTLLHEALSEVGLDRGDRNHRARPMR
jgi:hypothetical protein